MRELLAPRWGVEKSLALRSGRRVLLREKLRRYLELQNEESDLSDGGNENRDFPDPARRRKGKMSSTVKMQKMIFSIEVKQDYNRSTDVTTFPPSFDYWNENFSSWLTL
jgi:hypothetical protein